MGGSGIKIIEEKLEFFPKPRLRRETSILVLHHSAGEGSVKAVHNYHRGFGWSGIGYHFYVRRDGSVYRGRAEDSIGSHTGGGYNSFSIAVCAEGNFEREKMGKVQAESLRELCAYLKARYPGIVIKLHRELDCTVCPGQNFPKDFILGKSQSIRPKSKDIEIKTPLDDRRRKIKAFQLWINRQEGTDKLILDGIFGQKTLKETVKIMQKELNLHRNAKLAVDGLFGVKTRAAFTPPLKKGDISPLVFCLQGLLTRHFHDCGEIDGVFSSRTEAALRAFQREQNLKIDGLAGKESFYALCRK